MATRSGLLSKQELRQFVKEHNFQSAEDIQKTLKELFADVLQEALEAELDTHLGYERHDVKNKQTRNSRNGYSKKTVTSEYGDVEIEVPRDRLGEFEPVVVKKN
ncbi:transposase, partial [Paenibacillus ehimensis]|uniref:transposase n=1 Tax=Paenibacillus ehimensis TaxID=79264 RepID=UPI003D2CD5CE